MKWTDKSVWLLFTILFKFELREFRLGIFYFSKKIIIPLCIPDLAYYMFRFVIINWYYCFLQFRSNMKLHFLNWLVNAELMLLGFISLLLTVLQGSIVKICVPKDVVMHLLPCSLSEAPSHASPESGHHRRQLAEEAAAGGYCTAKVINSFFLV